ncbi:MAG: CRISPR-associated endonuclease Cas1, partial [Planctomycetaceae bacterium]|nr:CRISPR-associated endonuclease Cas1 [Planctomycetaceae bacterium]
QTKVSFDEKRKLKFAIGHIAAKIRSQTDAARHYQRKGIVLAGETLHKLEKSLRSAETSKTLEFLRGIEGDASATWFALLGQILKKPWVFNKRVRRPPTDPVNALLSLGYSLLTTRAAAMCSAVGLEPNIGTLHEYRAGRPSLACDIVEPFRVPVVDRWVIQLCNQGKVQIKDFVNSEEGTRLTQGKFPVVLADWEQTWHNGGHFTALIETISAIFP